MATPIDVLSVVLILAGSAFVIIGGVGLLRLPDFYTRIHAAGITDTLGTWMILFGLMLHEGLTLNCAKLGMLLFFLLATSPLASHALAKAAFIRGLVPLQAGKAVDEQEGDDSA